MNHSDHKMDHSAHKMDHSGHMDHSAHADHSGHDMGAMDAAQAVFNATLAAATTVATEVASAVHNHVTGQDAGAGHDHSQHTGNGIDHSQHMGMDHSQHMGMDHSQDMGMDHSQHMSAGAATGAHGGHQGMMAMTFHFGVTEYVLFDAWHVTTAGGMVASCLGLFLIALLYEGLKYKREDLLRKNATRNQFDTIRVPTDGGVTEVTTVSPSQRMLSKHHFLQTFLHAVQVVVGYFLMLAFMTYNVWLGIAIVLGAAAGYFIFGSKKFVVVDVTEHCH